MHGLNVSNRDLFVKIVQLSPNAFVLTVNNVFLTLKYILMKPLRLQFYIPETDVFVWEPFVILYLETAPL